MIGLVALQSEPTNGSLLSILSQRPIVPWHRKIAKSCIQIIKQRLRLLQISGIEPLGEPAVDGGE